MIQNKNSGKTSFCKMFLECIKAILTNFDKKNGANYRNRQDGRSPAQSLNGATRSEGNRQPSENCVIGGTPMSKAMIQNKNSGKTSFCKMFLECIKAILTNFDKKNGANYRNRQDGRSPAQSLNGATRSEGNRQPSENCVIGGTPMSKAMIQNKNSGKTSFCKMFLECIKAILTNFDKKNGANYRNRTDDLFITSELLYRLS